jgi:hypothetical protein
LKKLSVKLLVSFLLVSVCAVFAAAQNPRCALPDAPKLLGLRLGMSPAEVQKVFGRDLKIKVKTSGDRTFFQNYIEKQPPASLRDVRALYLRFLDGALYQIEIFYAERAKAPMLETFAANLSAQMNFPADAWQFEKGRATIDCGAFTVVADKPLNPRVELTDAARRGEALARRKKSD